MTIIDEDDVADNLVAFGRRQEALSPLAFCELRLRDNFTLEMTVFDQHGAAEATVAFALKGPQPESFDLARLRAAWARWKDNSTFAA